MAGTLTIVGSPDERRSAGTTAGWLPDCAAEIAVPAPAEAGAIEEGVRAVLAEVVERDVVYVGPGYPPVDDPLAGPLREAAEAAGIEALVGTAAPFWMGALDAGAGFSVRTPEDIGRAELSASVVISGLMTEKAVAEVAEALRARSAGADLRLVAWDGPAVEIPEAGVESSTVKEAQRPYAVIVAPVSPLRDTRALESLLWVVERLRALDGCPWDRRQTHESLRRYLPEEAHEAAAAIADGDSAHLAEELGDVLLQIALHAQIANESGEFDFSDVVRAITEKMVHRHPHVFDEVQVEGVEDVLRNWEELKDAERAAAGSSDDGVSPGLPALTYAREVLKRAARAGEELEPAAVDGVLAGVGAALGDDGAVVLGEMLLHLVEMAGQHGLDPEFSLREALRRRMPEGGGS
ncbi:MAG: MazG family protein [Chloroflexota bacterium]|nr:MazG family protein [Chloroflexota bacterium]